MRQLRKDGRHQAGASAGDDIEEETVFLERTKEGVRGDFECERKRRLAAGAFAVAFGGIIKEEG